MTDSRLDVDESAADRILRMFARFTGAGFLFYLVLLSPDIMATVDRIEVWWTVAAVASVFASGTVLIALSFARETRWLRTAAGTAAIVYLAVEIAWSFAWIGPPLVGHGDGIWLSAFPGVASMAAAAAWRPPYVFTHLVIVCAAAQLINHVARDPSNAPSLVADIAFAIMFCSLFVGASVVALRTGRILDETKAEVHAGAALTASLEARSVERERFNALIHDQVLATLLAVTRYGGNRMVVGQARTAIAQLDDLRNGSPTDNAFDLPAVLAHLRSAANDVDDGIEIVTDIDPLADSFTVPADTARALASAMAESVRNSVRHAGENAERRVEIGVRRHRIRIEIVDTGRGFDQTAVPPHRLGLAVSVRARMRHLAGASSQVQSSPGHGTRITLTWNET